VFVRWDNLTREGENQHRLPGYREPAVVRTFQAPEALDMRFYEVMAKSVLNRVPKASRMPFRWTINPYRGCSHACRYCVWGETPILMADGRTKPIHEIEVGDWIYGTERQGRYLKFARTTVLDKWVSIKPAYRVTLEDGTELVASADHRFLTNRGWKHVLNSGQGEPDRAHLTENNTLVGTGRFAVPPVENRAYRLGYLSGIVRGDGTIWDRKYSRADGSPAHVPGFRLALTDLEALRRARQYLVEEGVETSSRVFQRAVGSYREMVSIGTGRSVSVARVLELIRWPDLPSVEWCRGFLAGIFDAEGCRSDFALRISNTDPEILSWTEACLKRFGFDVRRDPTIDRNGLTYIRIRGGFSEHLRFFHLTDPAITRKRTIEGQMVKTFTDLRVTSVEKLDLTLPLYDITTGTGDFIANGVVSHNCFARPTHEYLDFDAGRDFEREIVVKVNAPEVLRAELAKPSWTHEHVAMGTNTDPYQWAEARYKLMPGIWEALRDSATPCSVLTKSPLLLRDLELLQDVARHTSVSASFSVPTLDEKAWRETEPHTPHPRARLEAVAELNRAGIPTGVLIAPLMPGINDAPEQVERILDLATEAGATDIGAIALHLRGSVRGVFFDWLRANRPDLVPRYEALYARGAYAPPEERRRLSAMVSRQGKGSSFRLRADPGGPEADGTASGHERAADADGRAGVDAKPSRRARPVQQSLF
jgi:DNA repair photolyase